jgi:TetR/AcrR family transcriptional regulator
MILIKKDKTTDAPGKTAEKIFTAARAAFAENGYSGTHMDEIARRAGVNKATLYYQIGDKDMLYANVIHQVLGSIAGEIAKAVAGSSRPEEKLVAYIHAISSAVEKNPELPSIMMREVASDGAHLPHVVVQDIASVLIILTEIIEDGKKKGLFADVPPFLVHSMITGTILFFKKVSPIKDRQSWLPEAVKRYDKKLKKPMGDEVARLVLKAIQKETGGKR